MRHKIGLIIMLLSLLKVNLSEAKDLGVVGPTYKIAETNLLDFIYSKLAQYQKEGRIKEFENQFIKTVRQHVIEPIGSNITPAIKNNRTFFDPSIMLQKDIVNENGAIIAKAGTVINPLATVGLNSDLVFINGHIEKELLFAKDKFKQKPNSKIILVSGNIKTSNQKLNLAVYFDQHARLIKRFGIKHTPAIVSQAGNTLQIDEVAL